MNEIQNISKEVRDLENSYLHELDVNPKYSLEVDPENKYSMTEEEKTFVRLYVDYKSIGTVAEFMDIKTETARAYYLSYKCQQEIRRINLALYQRQFAARLLDLDEIGGYLTSLLTDSFVPDADKLKPKEKLDVAKMIIDINKLKIDSLRQPEILMVKEIDSEIKNLSISTIKRLIYENESVATKNNVIAEIDNDTALLPEEVALLSTLPTNELLDLIESTNKGDGKNE